MEKLLRAIPGEEQRRNFLTYEKKVEESEEGSKKTISRRKFLKYGAGVAAVAAGAIALMGKIPLPQELATKKTPATNDSTEPIVATVEGDQVTVMRGQAIVKTKDASLAAQIAESVSTGD